MALSELLERDEISHAFVDMDVLRHACPAPPGDPFNIRLGMRNLASIWANYRAAGIERLILADIVEDPSQAADYCVAIPGASVTIVRLTAPASVIARRLSGRETGDTLAWYIDRAAYLSALMDKLGVGEETVDTANVTATEAAVIIRPRIL